MKKSLTYDIWEDNWGKKLLLAALILALLIHGILVYFTLPNTYDAYVHIFFADHYNRSWFEPWEYRWYTGFLTISYPPLIHQCIALLSNIFPLKVSYCITTVGVILVAVVGIYRFTKLFFNKTTAGIAAIVAVLITSIAQTIHVYGQLPTITGLAFLLNALPFVYQYFVHRKTVYLLLALSFLSVVITSHHVTAIFGIVFFIAPLIFMALTDTLSSEDRNSKFDLFLKSIVHQAWKRRKELILFGGITIVLAITLIFPYWYWSKTDPITQVSIPHGSRSDFLEDTISGIVFFLIPLLPVIALLPVIISGLFRKRRSLGWLMSFLLCLLLGSGGTTPIPELILGETVFNILTLDRFSFWASIMAIPFIACFLRSFISGKAKFIVQKQFGNGAHLILSALTGLSYMIFLIYVIHLGSFRPLQPKPIDIKPIQQFLERDDHDRWRFLTLGFGDQMAWLSANTMAATVDGNYHSARRLPELTSRAVERLENAKFMGDHGIASLEDFLTRAEKYSLKYVFNNDSYYDPLLYYTGWSRTRRLENGIMVWEKGNISVVKPITFQPLHPVLKKMWGTIPLSTLLLSIFLSFYYLRYQKTEYYNAIDHSNTTRYDNAILKMTVWLPLIIFSTFMTKQLYELLWVNHQNDPSSTVERFYDHLDFQRFEEAYTLFASSPSYPLSQYLLEKSVMEGGLVPSYAKLDSISTISLGQSEDSAKVEVNTRWKTPLGKRHMTDTLDLVKKTRNWYIVPKPFEPEIPEYQIREYTFTLYKKQGKRLISSFPTVKDDRVQEPIAAYQQVNLLRNKEGLYITGELVNLDNIPSNMAIKAVLTLKSGKQLNYFPERAFRYNMAPKARSWFQIDMHGTDSIPLENISDLSLFTQTDISERGSIHGVTTGYNVNKNKGNSLQLTASFYDQMAVDLNIPGLLIAKKEKDGTLLQVDLHVFPDVVRSGLNYEGKLELGKTSDEIKKISTIPISLFINGDKNKALGHEPDMISQKNHGIAIQPHCYFSQPIYLQ